ncbi:MAG: VPLPA-CTERM-specific exosortase XrtD, partial [Pseudomonadota bacterium]
MSTARFTEFTRGLGNRFSPPQIALFAASAGFFVLAFWDVGANLLYRWGKSPELGHSYFIPLLSAWLVWSNRDAVTRSVGSPHWTGFFLLGFAALLLLTGRLTWIYLLQHVALVLSIAGAVLCYGGISLLRTVAAPIVFLFFAVPPPYWIITVLSWKFQAMSSVLGVFILRLLDVPVFLSGNIIELGEYTLQVAEACSGLRYLFPFLTLGGIAAYLMRGPLWQKAVVFLSTIPITIVMNSIRIAVTGYLVQLSGPQHTEGILHFFEGWVVFLLCMAALLGVISLLKVFDRGSKEGALESLASTELTAHSPSRGISKPLPAAIATASLFAIMLYVGVGLSTSDLVRPDRLPFAGILEEFPDLSPRVREIDPAVAEALGADDAIVADFLDADGEIVNIYLAYLEAQRDGRSWHSPRQCIPGGGWKITSHTVETAQFEGAAPYKLNRLVIENGSRRQLVYYWYEQRGRRIANEFVMKFWLIIDSVIRKRSDGSLVRVTTPIMNAETVPTAEARLAEFSGRLSQTLS